LLDPRTDIYGRSRPTAAASACWPVDRERRWCPC